MFNVFTYLILILIYSELTNITRELKKLNSADEPTTEHQYKPAGIYITREQVDSVDQILKNFKSKDKNY